MGPQEVDIGAWDVTEIWYLTGIISQRKNKLDKKLRKKLEKNLKMSENKNPSSKSIDIRTQEGLDLLKQKAKFYGHYAENLKVLELIALIEELTFDSETAAYEASKKFGW